MLKNMSIAVQTQPTTSNYILNILPKEDLARLLPDLEEIDLPLGHIIYRAEAPIKYLYFPNKSMVSVIATTMDGQCAEVGVIGREGVVGLEALMGADTTINEHIVQHADGAMRIKTSAVKTEFKRGGALHDVLLGFAWLMMMQISQTALCNRLHLVEQRLARWLLICADRAGTNKLQLTQEFLAIMLGVNRPTVTIAAVMLQSADYIKYSRGQIKITDREGLEHFTCDCYRTVKKQYNKFNTLVTNGE